MVMGGGSCSDGHGFESHHCILVGHFFTYTCKNCNDICLMRPKINDKRRPGLADFFYKKGSLLSALRLDDNVNVFGTAVCESKKSLKAYFWVENGIALNFNVCSGTRTAIYVVLIQVKLDCLYAKYRTLTSGYVMLIKVT